MYENHVRTCIAVDIFIYNISLSCFYKKLKDGEADAQKQKNCTLKCWKSCELINETILRAGHLIETEKQWGI